MAAYTLSWSLPDSQRLYPAPKRGLVLFFRLDMRLRYRLISFLYCFTIEIAISAASLSRRTCVLVLTTIRVIKGRSSFAFDLSLLF